MVDPWLLLDLFVTFARLALIAIGGMNSVLSEVYREVVDVHGWMSAAELADLIALTQASPGPNGQFVSLVGLRLAGIPGFFVAGLAVALPPAILAFIMSRAHRRLATLRWVRAAILGERSMPTVWPLGFAFTRRRNISPEPVATSSTRMPSSMPEAASARLWARAWKKNVDAG